MPGKCDQRIAECQHHDAQHNDALGAEYFVAQPAADSHQTVNQGAKGGKQRNGVRFRHPQLFDQIDGHNGL